MQLLFIGIGTVRKRFLFISETTANIPHPGILPLRAFIQPIRSPRERQRKHRYTFVHDHPTIEHKGPGKVLFPAALQTNVLHFSIMYELLSGMRGDGIGSSATKLITQLCIIPRTHICLVPSLLFTSQGRVELRITAHRALEWVVSRCRHLLL